MFAQEIDYTIPTGFEKQISQKEYNFILDKAIDVINQYAKVAAVDWGEIQLEALNNNEQPIFYIDNVLKKCIVEDKKSWKKIVKEHFENYFEGLKSHEKLDVHNFEAIRPYLSIRIYEEKFVKDYSEDNWITKTDLPGTTSVLMLSMPTTFTTVTKDVFALWKKSKEEIFAIAQQNVNENQIFKHTEFFEFNGNDIEINILQNENIGSSFVLDLAHTAPEFIGELGSVVAVPNKGFVIMHKISREEPLEFMQFIQANVDFVHASFSQHPQPVSQEFFWYYKGKFTRIHVENGANFEILAPLELSQLIAKINK